MASRLSRDPSSPLSSATPSPELLATNTYPAGIPPFPTSNSEAGPSRTASSPSSSSSPLPSRSSAHDRRSPTSSTVVLTDPGDSDEEDDDEQEMDPQVKMEVDEPVIQANGDDIGDDESELTEENDEDNTGGSNLGKAIPSDKMDGMEDEEEEEGVFPAKHPRRIDSQSPTRSASLSPPPPPSSEVKPRPLPNLKSTPQRLNLKLNHVPLRDSDVDSPLDTPDEENASMFDGGDPKIELGEPDESSDEIEDRRRDGDDGNDDQQDVSDKKAVENGDSALSDHDQEVGGDPSGVGMSEEVTKSNGSDEGDATSVQGQDDLVGGQAEELAEGDAADDAEEAPGSPISIQPLRPHSTHAPPPTSAAMKALLRLEVKFAALRDKLYLERTREAAKEEEMIADALAYMYRALSARRVRQHEVASRRHKETLEELKQVREQDQEGVWTWWTDERDRLHWEEFEHTWSKRRRLAREKNELESARPVKPIPRLGLDRRGFDWAAGATPAKLSGAEAAHDLALMDLRRAQASRHASPYATYYGQTHQGYNSYPVDDRQATQYNQRQAHPLSQPTSQPPAHQPQPAVTTQRPHHPFGPYPTHVSSVTSVVHPRREGRTVPTSGDLFDGSRREARLAGAGAGAGAAAQPQATTNVTQVQQQQVAQMQPTLASTALPGFGSNSSMSSTVAADRQGNPTQMINAWRERLVTSNPTAVVGTGTRPYTGYGQPVPNGVGVMDIDKQNTAQPTVSQNQTNTNDKPVSRFPALGVYLNRQDPNTNSNGATVHNPTHPTGVNSTTNPAQTSGIGSNVNAAAQKLGLMSPPNAGMGGLFGVNRPSYAGAAATGTLGR